MLKPMSLLALMTLASACATTPPTDTRQTLCEALQGPSREAAAVVAAEGSDAVVLAVEPLVRLIRAGCT